jgi:hypothetical protein
MSPLEEVTPVVQQILPLALAIVDVPVKNPIYYLHYPIYLQCLLTMLPS